MPPPIVPTRPPRATPNKRARRHAKQAGGPATKSTEHRADGSAERSAAERTDGTSGSGAGRAEQCRR